MAELDSHDNDDFVDSVPLLTGNSPVDGYVLVEELGAGGFGAVWRAEGPGGVSVALKFIPLGRAHDEAEFRAIRVMKDVRHSNILGMSGVWQKHGYLIVAMELGDCTLLDRFKEYQKQDQIGIPQEELWGYMNESAKGIDFLNAKGIQHRDIKPQNLLLVGGAIKVADFGLAKLLHNTMTGHTGTLTPHYAAPEFFRGNTHAQSDQYSLAVTYCLLRGGRLPFAGPPADIMLGHLSEEPDLEMLPPAEVAVVRRALSKEPHDRWPSCRHFVQALCDRDSVVPLTEPVTHPPASPSAVSPSASSPHIRTTGSRTVRLPQKSRKLQIAVVVLGILFTLTLPVVLWVLGPGTPPSKPDTKRAKGTDKPTVKVPPKDETPETDTSKKDIAKKDKDRPKDKDKLKPKDKDKAKPKDKDKAKPKDKDKAKPKDKDKAKPKDSSVKPPPPPVLGLAPLTSVEIEMGQQHTIPVSVMRKNFDGVVRLRIMDVPKGVEAVVDSVPSGETTAKLSLFVTKSAVPGKHVLTLVASYDKLEASQRLTLTVRKPPPPPPPASLKVLPLDRIVLTPGVEQKVKFTVLRTHYDGPINVQLVGLPKDVKSKAVTLPKGQKDGEISLSTDTTDIPSIGKATLRATTSDGKVQAETALPTIVRGTYTNSIGMKFTLIPPGTFEMGSPPDEVDRGEDELLHKVTITKPFYLGVYEVTQGEYKQVIGKNPSFFHPDTNPKYTLRHPVEQVTWHDADNCCKKLGMLEKEKGKTYRLPTEAEWEYACRAGARPRSPVNTGDTLTSTMANFDGMFPYPMDKAPVGVYRKRTVAVGSVGDPNAWGLHDMHGNVGEWCWDWYSKSYYGKSPPKDPLEDPQGPKDGEAKCLRGGSYLDPGRNCRSAFRASILPKKRDEEFGKLNGFRVVLEIDD